MKKHILIAALGLLTIMMSGCGQSTIINDAEESIMRKVASNSLGIVYVVAIDGDEYILVLGGSKAAICPKK